MTKTLFTSSMALLAIMLMFSLATSAIASEVTGTLSSDSGANGSTLVATSDNELAGSVIGGSSGGSGGSRSSGTRTNDSSATDTSSGTVLGATASNLSSPGFPNAGTAPDVRSSDQPLWSAIMSFIMNVLSF